MWHGVGIKRAKPVLRLRERGFNARQLKLTANAATCYEAATVACFCPQVAAFQCLQPFIGTLLAFLVLNESPTPWDLGAIGIVAGLLLVTTDRRDLDTQAVFARIRRLVSQRSLAVSRSMRDLTSLARWPGTADD
jgi:hypothetical protein